MIINGEETEVNCMGKAVIEFEGNPEGVGVGSGWSDEERIKYLEHPEELIGQIITVQFFEHTKDQFGKPSLRFPVKKALHGQKREV